MSVQQKNYRKSFGSKGGGQAARDDTPRDGPLRNSMGQIVKEGKPKGGAWEDKRNGGGKKSDWVEKKVWTREEIDAQDSDFGYEKFVDGGTKEGWLITFSPTTITHPETNKDISAVECYLTMQDGSKFKCLLLHKPYFYVSVVEINRAEMREIDNIIRKKYSDFIVDTQVVEKEDLDLPNHLSGIRQTYLKIIFDNTKDLVAVRNELLRIINRNKDRGVTEKTTHFDGSSAATMSLTGEGLLDCLIDIREYDVPYHMRVCIDLEIRVGKWYDVSVHEGFASFIARDDLDKCIGRADPVTLAWDIECTKKPLKFPDAKNGDEIFMISYMVDGQGFLIISREVVSSDIQDFEYTPKPEFEGPFTVFNESNEFGLIHRFLDHIRELKPSIFVTYNGDFFDWPFLNDRCKHHGINLEERIGFSLNQDVYTSRFAVHIDCFAWVQRDSYLPQGSQGLKAVTRAKLDYEPVEVDPEEMVAFAQSNPQTMATYSVSDAVATYYLYQKYVQPFIFSLCNIIPMTPDDVLRKGSGTLCEVLLMVSAFRGNIICPNKTVDEPLTAHGEHYLDTQTYVGGHVEALQSGVYRSDLKYKFKMDPAAFDELIANLDRDLEYALMVGHRVKKADVVNYEEKRQEILDALLALKATPRREENPLIIHLDVGAMYPNIILSNRLQPPAMVKPETCAACDYFSKIGECRRDMKWDWRAEAFPATKADVRQLRGQMNQESREAGKPEPSIDELKVRIRKYSQMVYKKQHKTIHEERTANVCQRENPFYVNTVLEFKERRMVYKGEKKSAEGRLKKAMAEKNALDTQTAEKMVVLYESLQLAHKCILNSFYGYVMRKGARWYSMEMAGVVTHLGANIIRMARELIERIGIPLELDTDGIWCCLPASFPQGIKFVVRDSANPGKTKNAVIQYGCEMLNAKLEQEFTNHQYHVLDPKTGEYTIKSECSIAFELDGPYLAMILPASTQEDKRLKKRYAVFNHNKTLAELKGFEIKRRGELQLIKNFQEMVFKRFLDGGTLEECYSAVSNVANEMLDIIDERGQNMEDEALLNIISESSTMSRALLDYGAQKSCAITTAKRLGEVLGEDTVKDKGLQCRYIISKLPQGSPVTERAVPVKIFMMDKTISLACLKRWLKDSSLKGDDVDIRNVLDWGYYRERLANCIAKIVTIPAAMQGIVNPVPRVPHPEWLQKRIAANDNTHKQTSIASFFNATPRDTSDPFAALDMEDLAKRTPNTTKKLPIVTKRGKGAQASAQLEPPAVPALSLKSTDYKLWLSQMKAVWLYNMERKRLCLAGVIDFDSAMAPRRNAGVSSFIAGRARNVMQQSWQIIEICETQIPGQLRLWVYLPDGSMEQLLLNMDRTLYMNFRKPKNIIGANGAPLSALNRRLPFRRPTLSLYEVSFSEEEFQKKSDSIRQALADPDVEGVYESKTPLVFRAVSEIGAVARYRSASSRSQSQLAPIRLTDVQMLNTVQCPYLQSSQPKCMYLHVLSTEKQGVTRLMASLWAPMGDSKGYIVCMNNGISSKESAAMTTLYRQRVARLPVELRVSAFVYPEHLEFELKSVPAAQTLLENGAAVANFWKQVSNIIQNIISKKLGPMVLVHSTPFSSMQLKAHVAAASDLPVIPILYADAVFAPFLNAPAKIIDRFLEAPWYYHNFISLARQLHIPVGNLQLCTQFGAIDIYTTATDVLFSRLLRQNSYIWWASPSGIADFGGNESSLSTCADIDLEHVEISRKGSYRSYCITLEIGELAAAAILNFLELEDVSNLHEAAEAPIPIPYDGSTPAVDFLIDDTISSIDAFKVLNTMIKSWILQYNREDNVMAQKLLSSIYRWTVGNSSMFRAPILKQYLQRNMQKILTELITHVQNLGGYVVFASFNKLIVKTTKPTMAQAKQYCNFLIRSIHDDSRFKCLLVSPTSYWSWLLLLDGHNFGGYMVENAIGVGEDSSLSQVPSELPGVASYWNLAEHLPQMYQPIFHELIRRVVEAPYNERMNRMDAGQILSLPGAGPLQASQAHPLTDSPTTEHDLKAIISLVRTDPRQESLVQAELVKKIFQLVSAARGDTTFNKLPSNRHPDLTPAIAFVNYFCEVASLEPEILPDIINVKRQVLGMLQVKEFSPVARFENPAPKLVLPAVFCPLCSHGQDIDLCRDHGALSKAWRCINCAHSLDFDAVHSLLFESVRRLVLLSQTQDVICVKCKQSQKNPLMSYCKCSGKFEAVLSKQEIEKKLRAIAQVAQYYEMHQLSEQVQWALSI